MTNYTQWKSLVDLHEYSAIPDSVENQSFAWYPFDQYDTATTSGISDESPNDNTLDQGQISGYTDINGVQAGLFDGGNDHLYGPQFSDIEPATAFIVAEMDSDADTSDSQWLIETATNDAAFGLNWFGGEGWQLRGDDGVFGSSDNTVKLFTCIWDGSSGTLRENGSVTADSANISFSTVNGIEIGAIDGHDNSGAFWDGAIGEVILFDDVRGSNEIGEVEDYLNEKWELGLSL